MNLSVISINFSGFITDAIGTHSVFGAFVFGLAIPNGPVGVTVVEKLDRLCFRTSSTSLFLYHVYKLNMLC